MRFRVVLVFAALFLLPSLSPAVIKQRERNVLQEAEEALRNRDAAGALKALDDLIEQQPENAAAFFWRGRLLAEQGKHEKALADLDEAIRLEPRNADAWSHRGYVRQKRGEPDEAMADFNRALRRDPNNEFALYCRGLLLGDRGETRAALADLDAVIEMNPRNIDALHARGQVYMVRRDLTAALLDFDLCVNLNPDDMLAYNGRGSVHFLQGKYKEAVADYTKAMSLKPTKDARTLAQRGYAYAGLGDSEKAGADFEEALKLDPKEGAALLGRAELRRTKKDWAAALADYDAALALAPDDFRGLLGRAAVYFGSGALEKALTAYAEVEKRYPDEPQPFNDHAWLLATGTKDGLRDGARAVELASRACELTQWENPAYLDTLAAAYAEKGDFSAALKWQELAVKLSDNEPPDVQTDIKSRIALYEKKEPYREVLK